MNSYDLYNVYKSTSVNNNHVDDRSPITIAPQKRGLLCEKKMVAVMTCASPQGAQAKAPKALRKRAEATELMQWGQKQHSYI